jgi:hypothetical protein
MRAGDNTGEGTSSGMDKYSSLVDRVDTLGDKLPISLKIIQQVLKCSRVHAFSFTKKSVKGSATGQQTQA